MHNAKEITRPLSTIKTLKLHDGVLLSNAFQYHQVVRALQYLAFTRPDISFVVNKLSQFLHHPLLNHQAIVKKVPHYLKSTMHHNILLLKSLNVFLCAFSNID